MIRVIGVSIGVLLACAAAAAPAPRRFTDKQLAAVYSFDLGPDQIDVSSYPKGQQTNYKAFEEVCSRCHTLARPINAPFTSRADWKRFVERMHVRSKIQSDKTFDKDQAKSIVDFLAYDSAVRKVQHRAAFDAEAGRLKTLFADVRAERSRVQIESDRRKARPYNDQSSALPTPTPRP